eukprot:1228632-Alexandrium_andersonii.AAC.1
MLRGIVGLLSRLVHGREHPGLGGGFQGGHRQYHEVLRSLGPERRDASHAVCAMREWMRAQGAWYLQGALECRVLIRCVRVPVVSSVIELLCCHMYAVLPLLSFFPFLPSPLPTPPPLSCCLLP